MPSACFQRLGRARVVPAQPPHDPQVAEGVGLAQPVAEVPSGLHGGGVAGDGVGPGAIWRSKAAMRGGEGDDPGMLPGCGGMIQAGQQVGALGPRPGQRPDAVRQVGNRSRRRVRAAEAAWSGPGGPGGRRRSAAVCW